MNTTLAYDQDDDLRFAGQARLRFLSTKLDLLISPLPVWLDEWAHPEDDSNPDLLHNIARDGVQL